MSERGRRIGGGKTLLCVLKAVEEHGNGENHAYDGTNKVCPFERICVLVYVLTLNNAVYFVFSRDGRCDYGYEHRNKSRAECADKTGNGKDVSANLGVVCKAGGKSPIGNIRDRIDHAPNNIDDRNYNEGRGFLRFKEREEAHHRDNCNGNSHPFKVRAAFTPFCTGLVNDTAHYRVVHRVVDTRAEHEISNCHRTGNSAYCCVFTAEKKCVGKKYRKIRAYNGADEILPEAGHGIRDSFLGLNALAGGRTEQLVKKFLHCLLLLAAVETATRRQTKPDSAAEQGKPHNSNEKSKTGFVCYPPDQTVKSSSMRIFIYFNINKYGFQQQNRLTCRNRTDFLTVVQQARKKRFHFRSSRRISVKISTPLHTANA